MVFGWRYSPISGAQALDQGGAAVIAGLVGAIGGRVLREGYARVSFLGAHEGIMETVLLSAPGKILRDSPAALPRAQKKLMRSAERQRLVFWPVSFILKV